MFEQIPQQENLDQQKKNRIRRIVALFKNGLDTDDSIGYHGTSLEAIEFLLEHGYLPSGRSRNPRHRDSMDKYIHFYPKKSEFEDDNLVDESLKDEDIIEEASGYASDIAKEHYLLKSLGLSLDDPKIGMKARSLGMGQSNDPKNPNEEYNTFLNMGIKKEVLDKSIKEAQKRKGIVLALKKSINKSFTPIDGDMGDLKISTPEGLNLGFISGLEPRGQKELDYFKKLQEEHG